MKNVYFSIANNLAFPIEIQYKQLCKNIIEPFEFILVNGGDSKENIDGLYKVAQKLGIQSIPMPKEYHSDKILLRDPTRAYAMCVNYILQEYIKNKNIKHVIISHVDVFPIKRVSILNILNGNPIACQYDTRLIDKDPPKICKYIYPMLFIIDITTAPAVSSLNFNNVYLRNKFGENIPLDCGGETHTYVSQYSNLMTEMSGYEVIYMSLDTFHNDFDDSALNFFIELKNSKQHNMIENTGAYYEGFYHFTTGSNWVNREGFTYKINLLYKYFG